MPWVPSWSELLEFFLLERPAAAAAKVVTGAAALRGSGISSTSEEGIPLSLPMFRFLPLLRLLPAPLGPLGLLLGPRLLPDVLVMKVCESIAEVTVQDVVCFS